MKVYINKHLQEQFSNRVKQGRLELNKRSLVEVLVQREKNGTIINQLKGCIALDTFPKTYLIVNVYKHKQTQEFVMKGLTVLTEGQLKTSRNFGCGNKLKKAFKMNTETVLYKEKYFDLLDYEDFFKGIEWSEEDVIV